MGFCLSWQRRFAEAEKLKRPVKPPNMCDECGFVAQSPFGLMSHKKSHKKKVVSPLDMSYDYEVWKTGGKRASVVRDEESQAEEWIAARSKPQMYRIEKRAR